MKKYNCNNNCEDEINKSFCEQIDKLHSSFEDDIKNKHPEIEYSFKETFIVKEFADYIKNNIKI